MLGFNHTAAGSIIALVVPAPIVPLVAYISHFLLDLTPHFGEHSKFAKGSRGLLKLIIFDGLLCCSVLLLSIFLFPDKWFIIGVGAFFSVLPDLQWIFARYVRTPQWFLDFSTRIQWGERPWGWVLELIYLSVGIFMLFQLR